MSAVSERDRDVVRAILRDMGSATYADLSSRGGKPLASPLMELVQAGEVRRVAGDVVRYELATPPA